MDIDSKGNDVSKKDFLDYIFSINKGKLIFVGIFFLFVGITLEVVFEYSKADTIFETIFFKVFPKLFYSFAVIILTDCIFHLIQDRYTQKLHKDEIASAIKMAIDLTESESKKRLDGVGIIDADKTVNWEWLYTQIRKAEREVTILQFWMPDEKELFKALKEAIENGVKVRIALLDSRDKGEMGTILKLRMEQLPNEKDDIMVRMKIGPQSIAHLHNQLPLELKSNIELFYYKTIPSISIFKIDSEIIFSTYLFNRLADDNVQIHVTGRNKSLLYTNLTNHLEKYFSTEFGAKMVLTTNVNFKPRWATDIEDDTDYSSEYNIAFGAD